jgi:hypothetical protein
MSERGILCFKSALGLEERGERNISATIQMQSTCCALLQDPELMPQNQSSASSRRRDLKQSYSKRTKRKAIAIIRRSCSDSVLTASQMD